MSKIFIDTNILIYSLDRFDLKKLKYSRQLLLTLQTEHTGVLSTQVLQEFYVSATTKLFVTPLMAKNILKTLDHFEIVTVTKEIIHEAIDIQQSYRLSFWDSLIIAAAVEAKCSFIWTEDLNNGQIIRSVQVVNPYL